MHNYIACSNDTETAEKFLDKELAFFMQGTANQLANREVDHATHRLMLTQAFLHDYLLKRVSDEDIERALNAVSTSGEHDSK